FERRGWPDPGAKERAVRERFGISPTRYYHLLNTLLDDPRALAHDPVTVNRLRRLREQRRRRRCAAAPALPPGGAAGHGRLARSAHPATWRRELTARGALGSAPWAPTAYPRSPTPLSPSRPPRPAARAWPHCWTTPNRRWSPSTSTARWP